MKLLKRKLSIISLISLLFLTAILTTANASNVSGKDIASGGGVFIHEHQGVPHTHIFALSVSDSSPNPPIGTFNLVCKHDQQIEIMIHSTQIESFDIQTTQGGLRADFSGIAQVKMNNGIWEDDWRFQVTAYDLDGKGVDLIGVTLINPQGQVHCSAEPTPIASGNIVIKT
jgi:hypothetical protein